MTPPSLALARSIIPGIAAAEDVTIITPDSPDITRALAYLVVAKAGGLSVADARKRVSLYIPALASDIEDVIALVWSAAPRPITAPAMLLSEGAWAGAEDDDAPGATLAGVVGHEAGHRRRDVAVRDATQPLPVVGSALWALTYLVHAPVRGWDEGTCYTSDMTADVVLRGTTPGDAFARASSALRSGIYRLDTVTERVGIDALRSCADSLSRGALHGVGSPMHGVMRALRAKGWDAGEWNAVIDA